MSKVMEFKAKFIGDVSDITSNIKDLQQELNKLTLPDNLKGQFTKVINNLEKNTEKASKSLAAGFKTKGDVSSYEKTMNLIVSDMEKLSVLMDRIDVSKLDFKVDGTQIKALVEYIAQLKAQINAISVKKLTDVQEIANKRSDTKKNAASWTEFFEAFKKGDEGIDDCGKALKRLQTQVSKAAEKAGGVENLTGKWAEYAKDVKVYEDAFSALKGDSKELVPIKEELIRKEEELKNIQEEYTKAGEESVAKAKEGTKQMTVGVKQYAKESSVAAENTQQLGSSLDSFKNKAAYFFGLSNAVNLFKRAVRSAYATVKDLDDVMTETAVVTDFSVGDMWDQLPEYTQRANELGVSIHDAYEAATLYYQQGLKTNEVMAVSNETLKMARIAGLDAATATDRMTNALRGFNMEIDENNAQRINDVYSKLAAITASDTNEISTAMTKTASLAHSANMEFETTAAFLAQMIETTRESAETAGTALKTVIARFSEVKKLYSEGELLGTDEEGEEIDVNKVSQALRSAGINMNEYLTGAKGLDDIFIELASKWDSLDMIQQRYIATMAAGSRQQSRFIAMMSDYKRTMELVDAANNSTGASQKQFEKTLDSLKSKLEQLGNSWKTFLMGIADNTIVKGVIDLLTKLLDTINGLFSNLDGLPGSIARVSAAFATLMGGKAITKTIFGKIGSLLKGFNGAGEEASKGFLGGFSKGIKNEAKKLFSKQYWNELAGSIQMPSPMDPTEYKNYIRSLEDMKKDSNNIMSDKFLAREFTKIDLMEGEEQKIAAAQAITASRIEATKDLAGVTQTLTVAEKLEGTEAEKSAVLRKMLTDETFAAKVEQQGLTKAEIESVYAEEQQVLKQEQLNAVRGKSTLSLIAATFNNHEWTASLAESTLFIGLETKANEGNLAALLMVNIAKTFAIKTTLGLVAATAGYVAVIGLAIYAVYKLVKYFWDMREASPEDVLEETTEATENMKKAADEASQSLKNLKGSLESLEEKYSAIEGLTRGTKEWKEAVREVNSEVLSLMGTYEGLKIVNENGILKITNAEEVNEQLANTKARLEAMQIGSQQQQVRAQLAVDFKNSGLGEYFERAEAEELAKGLIAGTISAAQIKEDNYLVDDEVIQGLIDFGNKLNAATEQIDMYSEALATNAMENTEFAKGTEEITRNYFNPNRMEELYIEEYNKLSEYNADSIKKAAAKIAGKKETDSDYKDYIENLDLGSAMAQLAQAFVRKRVQNESQQLSSGLSGIDPNTLKYISSIYGSKDLSGFSEADLKGINEKGIDNVVKEIADSLWELKTDEEKANTNYEAFYEDIRRDVQSSYDNSGAGFDQYSRRMHNMYVTNPETFGVTADVANKLADHFTDVFTVTGSKGILAIQDEITKVLKEKGLEGEEANNFVKAINGLDWKNADNMEASLQESLKVYGLTDIEVSDLTDSIIKFAKAASNVDLEKLTEEVSGLASLASKIKNGAQKETGWTKEDVQRAVSSGAANVNDFIINIEDGTYTYIGETLDNIYDELCKIVDEEVNVDDLRNRQRDAKIVEDLASRNDLTTRSGQESFLYGAASQGIISRDQANAIQTMSDKEISDLVNHVRETNKFLAADEQALHDLEVTELMLNNTNEQLVQKAKEGDEIATDAITARALNAGVSRELIDRNDFTQQAGLADTFEEAQKFGYDTNELNEYIRQLKILHGELDDVVIAQVALSNTKHVNGLKKIIDSYDTWTNLLKEDGTLVTDLDKESAKFIEEFKDATEEMLNTKLSDGFWYGEEAAKNIDLIKQAAEGSTEALIKLQTQAAKDYLISEVKIDKESAETELIEIENWLLENAPVLDVGTSIDEGPFIEGLNDMMRKLNLSKTQMENILRSIHWEGKIIDLPGIEIPNPTYILSGGKEGSPTIKMPGGLRLVSATKSTGNSPSITPVKSSGSGGGSGSGKEDKSDYWENPYDELYNLQEKINEALRTREALERRYQKLLKQTASDLQTVTKAYYDQITHLRTEADLQNQMQAGRLRQIGELGQDIYTDSEGNRSTFASLGVTKYASYDAQTGTITIDWEGLEAIANDPNRTEEGKAAEAYISKLEELVGKFEEVRDKLWEIEDKIEELRQEAIDNYLTFEDRVMDALKNQYQQEIDDFKALSDTIKEATDEVISGIQEDVALARQIRDNTKKEEDIAEKEARLAYLKRDSSGANDLEVKKLEKELEQDRQDYSDTLVDQQIQAMQDEANKAAEQREHQIELMQHSLDMAIENGELWEEVYRLIDSSTNDEGVIIDNSPLMELLKSQEAFGSLSKIGQAKWWEEVTEAVKKALVGLGVAEDKYNIGDSDRRTGTSIDTFVSHLYEQILGRTADEAGKGWWAEQIQSGKMSRADVIKSFLNSDEFKNKKLDNDDFVEMLYQSFFGRAADKEGKEYWANQLKTGAKSREDIINEFFKSAEWTNSMIPRGNTGEVGPIAGIKKPFNELHGSVRPEMVLNEKDSENIISLRDILKNTFGSQSGVAVKSNGGDNYFDINISAEIGSDYDVDQLADKIEQKIYNDSSYRNVNMIRGLR